MRRWEVGRPSALEVYGRLMEEGRPLRYEDGRQNGKPMDDGRRKIASLKFEHTERDARLI